MPHLPTPTRHATIQQPGPVSSHHVPKDAHRTPSAGVGRNWDPERALLYRRAAAWLIDVTPYWVVWLLIEHTLGTVKHLLALPSLLAQVRTDPAAVRSELVTTVVVLSVAVCFSLLLTGAWIVTRTWMLSRHGSTPGKSVCGLRVISTGAPAPRHPAGSGTAASRGEQSTWLSSTSVRSAGEPPSIRQALLRVGWPQLAGAIPVPGTGMIPYLASIADPDGRGIHEHHSHTRTIRSPR